MKNMTISNIEKENLSDEIKERLYKIAAKLENKLSARRYKHTVNVMFCAIKLAERYQEDVGSVAVASLLHDCAREIRGKEALLMSENYGIEIDEISSFQPSLLHGKLGAIVASEEYGIKSKEEEHILTAIRYHTTGFPGMGKLVKITLLADFIEPERDFPGVAEIREMAFTDLDKGVLAAMDSTIIYLLNKNSLIHPDTIHARNWLIKELTY
jgi:predicted HD superfamily hydrolase involved in NAD metabolism